MTAKLHNFWKNLTTMGWLEALKMYRYRIEDKWRDWTLGVNTQSFIPGSELGYSTDCHAYEATTYATLDAIFRVLNPQKGDVFLDYGCGLGRAVLVAATYPYTRVIGVELTTWLAESARLNVANARPRLACKQVEIATADACRLELPDDVNTIFLFNPFSGETMKEVQEQIYQSMQRSARRMQIVYMYPTNESNEFANCGWLTKTTDVPTVEWSYVRMCIFECDTIGNESL